MHARRSEGLAERTRSQQIQGQAAEGEKDGCEAPNTAWEMWDMLAHEKINAEIVSIARS